MALRAAFGPAGGSPLRMVGPGGNINNPLLSDIVFDANHSPLRVLQSGIILVQSAGSNVPTHLFMNAAAAMPQQASAPLIIGLWKHQADASPANAVWQVPTYNATGSGTGGGVAVQPNVLWGLNWWKNIFNPATNAFTFQPIYVAYLVLRNRVGA